MLDILKNSTESILPWLVVGALAIVLFELFLMAYYRRRALKASKRLTIAPIHFKGSFPEGFKESALASLRTEMDDVNQTYKEMAKEFHIADSPVELGKELCIMMTLSSKALNLDPSEHPKDFMLIEEHLKNIKIKYKVIEASLNEIIKVLMWIIFHIPAPYRRNYLRKQIHVMIVSVRDEYQITVYRKNEIKNTQSASEPAVSKLINKVDKNKVGSKPFRETAFMILEVHGKAFKGLNWKGMMHFTDGLVLLISYMKKPNPKLLQEAKNAFSNAIIADNYEYEAHCFLGALLVAERKEPSINKAIQHFKEALQTDRPRFKAFVHAGLAHCYAQQYHRLAKRDPEVIDNAREHARRSASIWNETEDQPQPWIQYTQAITMIIDEGIAKNSQEELKNYFIPAMNLCLEAIGGDEKNKLFYNTLGWMLLKLAENDLQEITVENGISEKLAGNVAEKAEHYLKKSLEFDKKNKLSNANLCLLYSTTYFREKSKESPIPNKYLKDCKSYGERAITIDPGYINGYRDLAVSFIRYKEFDDAYEYYVKALEKATAEEKDNEIMEDIIKLLHQVSASENIIEKFRHPPPEFL